MIKLICSVCNTEPHSDDAGFGIEFKKGDTILCKKTRTKGNLHYHDIDQLEEMVLETARGEADWGREVYSLAHKEGIVIRK